MIGVVAAWNSGETLDESPETLGIVQRMGWAYLMGELCKGGAWEKAWKVFEGMRGLGRVKGKE